MERVIIRRRGGFRPTQLEVFIGEHQLERVVSYQVVERSNKIPQVTFTVECDELIEDLEFEDAELNVIGEKHVGDG